MSEHSDFSESSIAHGCVFDEFYDLETSKKNKLISILSRVMESAYRRGVQHALAIPIERVDPKLLQENGLYEWRYESSKDDSIGIDFFKSTSKERLFMEHGCLRELGFCDSEIKTESIINNSVGEDDEP